MTASRRSLVTGGAGFIGSNLVDALLEAGDVVTVVDDLSTGRAANLQGARRAGATMAELDIRAAAAVDALVADAAPDRIFHLAAQIDVRRSMADPAADAATNVVGTINVLSAAQRHGVSRVVNTSTGGAIYGTADVVPTPESSPERPLAAYGTSKLAAELYCAWFARTHGLSTITLRLANVYGPRQDPLGEAGVIAIFCDQLLGGDRPTVFGSGEQTRDFVFVGDVVRAQLAAAEATATGSLNIGTGRETTVLELAAAVASAAGVDPASFVPRYAEPRAGEVDRSCLDGSRAARELDFRPSTPLVEGLARTLEWITSVRASRPAP